MVEVAMDWIHFVVCQLLILSFIFIGRFFLSIAVSSQEGTFIRF
jgi:hypothetical protein